RSAGGGRAEASAARWSRSRSVATQTVFSSGRSREPEPRAGSSRLPAELEPWLADAERIPVRVAHDRERDVRADLRLHDQGACCREACDFRLTVVRGEVEVERIGGGA